MNVVSPFVLLCLGVCVCPTFDPLLPELVKAKVNFHALEARSRLESKSIEQQLAMSPDAACLWQLLGKVHTQEAYTQSAHTRNCV